MTSDPKAKFPSHHAPPAGREAGPFCNPLLPETFPRTRRCSEPAAARASPRQTTHTLPPTSPRQSSDPYLPPQRTNLSPKHKWGNFKRDHRAAPSQTPRPARTGGLARPRTPRFAKLEKWTEQRLRGPLGTPSTFREERCDPAGPPPPHRGGALREAARDGPSPRPPAAAAATAPAAPGPARGTPPPPRAAAPLRFPEGPPPRRAPRAQPRPGPRSPAGAPPRRCRSPAPQPRTPAPPISARPDPLPSRRHHIPAAHSPLTGSPLQPAGAHTPQPRPGPPQHSAPPGAASFSPGLAGTSAHGSPHRGYF
ncbi:vegetative cell wall protein gp1-like [Peromyscus leucopus]|uniref:vegetative cell wall protein gp1-like n=1 Tax=Peromyscus leucopus TaxID=10041 RepID=UPI0010A0F974|nr:vegetative cell wall protein gp1-like [Peromyscus leucopus]